MQAKASDGTTIDVGGTVKDLLEIACCGITTRSALLLIPYTHVNKRIRLFPKLHRNMYLVPNMRLIMKGKNRPHPPNHDASLTWCSPWNLQRV